MSRTRLLEPTGFNQLVRGRDAWYLYNVNDSYIGRSIEKYGEYAGIEARFLARLCTTAMSSSRSARTSARTR